MNYMDMKVNAIIRFATKKATFDFYDIICYSNYLNERLKRILEINVILLIVLAKLGEFESVISKEGDISFFTKIAVDLGQKQIIIVSKMDICK